MKLKLFTIPNILTLSNLFCGSMALIEILLYQDFFAAFILIIASATFDFLDGAAARLLGQYSDLGRELDSLADVVSFGLTPAIAMFSLFNMADTTIIHPLWARCGAAIPMMIVCFSALRLARFNIDDEQKESFIGLPTPASALFCLSLGMLVYSGRVVFLAEAIAAISIVISLLLVAPMRFFALKFKNLSWHDNRVRYIFLLLAIAAIATLREYSISVVITIYVLVAMISNIICKAKRVE